MALQGEVESLRQELAQAQARAKELEAQREQAPDCIAAPRATVRTASRPGEPCHTAWHSQRRPRSPGSSWPARRGCLWGCVGRVCSTHVHACFRHGGMMRAVEDPSVTTTRSCPPAHVAERPHAAAGARLGLRVAPRRAHSWHAAPEQPDAALPCAAAGTAGRAAEHCGPGRQRDRGDWRCSWVWICAALLQFHQFCLLAHKRAHQ